MHLLFLRQHAREVNKRAGCFLKFRFLLLMGNHSERFSDTVIAEMRGKFSANHLVGEWLEEHFFQWELSHAELFNGLWPKNIYRRTHCPNTLFTLVYCSKQAQAVLVRCMRKPAPLCRC